jgi:hypothetical protein
MTYPSAHIVDELMSSNPSVGGVCIAYFYCMFRHASSQDPTAILGSFVAQLSTQIPSMLDTIRPIFAKHDVTNNRAPIEIDALEDSIVKYGSQEKRPILIFLDAINESVHAPEILSSLAKLITSSKNLRVLMTTTPGSASTVVSSLGNVNVIHMSSEVVQNDIEGFVDQQIEGKESLSRLKPNLRNEIRRTLYKKANGS